MYSLLQYCLSGPTRDEINRAHARNKWLDIGVLSMRNVMRVSRKRAMLFLLLGISSPLVQFLYGIHPLRTDSQTHY
jgi:hypothetical protein